MNKKIKIAVVGLGQVGNYLLNELNTKKKDIEIKTGKKIIVEAISAKNINKKRKFKINKDIFFKNPLEIFKKKEIDILFEAIGLSDGISTKNDFRMLLILSLKKSLNRLARSTLDLLVGSIFSCLISSSLFTHAYRDLLLPLQASILFE